MSEAVAPSPGIYKDVPFAEYCDWEAINNSSLGPALRSAKHYQHSLDNPRKDTDAFRFGRLCHEGRLEPALVLDRYVVMPDLTEGIDAVKPKATKAYKARVEEWKSKQKDKQVIEPHEFENLKGVLDAIYQNERSRLWFNSPGPSELSMVWPDQVTGLLCKARLDKLVDDNAIADLKTTRDAKQFERSIADYSYHRQAAFYLDGYRQLTGRVASFNFCVVESEAPYGVRAAPLSREAISVGRQEYRLAMQRISELRSGGVLGDYDNPDVFELPGYKRANEFTFFENGNRVEGLY